MLLIGSRMQLILIVRFKSMVKKNPKWYHWAILGVCALWMLAMGIMNIAWGASPSSRFYVIDDVVVRILGVGLVMTSLSLFFRQNWAFIGAISILAISILEIVVTDHIDAETLFDLLIMLSVMKEGMTLFFLLPIGLLMWLRIEFVARRTEQEDRPLSSRPDPCASPDEVSS